MKTLLSFLASFFVPVRQMANAMDHRKMLFDLLGLGSDSTEEMLNERYKKAMDASPDEAAKQMKAKCNELEAANATLKTQLKEKETLMANEVTAKTVAETKITELNSAKATAETNFSNERQARIKLIVSNAVNAGRITGSEVDEQTKLLANATDFSAAVETLEKKAKKINTTSQTSGLNNLNKSGSQASIEFSNEVARVQKETGAFYNEAWKIVERSEKGKTLLAQMHKPQELTQ